MRSSDASGRSAGTLPRLFRRADRRKNTAQLRDGRFAMDMHHLVRIDGEVRHRVERHDRRLFDAPTMRSAFRRAGF